MSIDDPTSPSDHDPSAATGNGQDRPAVVDGSAGEDQSVTCRRERSAAVARLTGNGFGPGAAVANRRARLTWDARAVAPGRRGRWARRR
jgi:hypothetical protein